MDKPDRDKYGTLFPRVIAWFIDAVLLLIVLFPIRMVVFKINPDLLTGDGIENFSSVLLYLYSIYCHGRFGRTVGKYIMNIRVYGEGETGTLGYFRALKRDSVPIGLIVLYGIFAYSVSAGNASLESREFFLAKVAFGIAVVWMSLEIGSVLLNKKRRAMHDLIAGTVVIRCPNP